jgi:hypothetical protein
VIDSFGIDETKPQVAEMIVIGRRDAEFNALHHQLLVLFTAAAGRGPLDGLEPRTGGMCRME